MVLNNIDKLIEKYENGETSIKEEAYLRTYFQNETIPPHLEMYKPLFAYFKTSQQERFTKDIPLQPKKRHIYSWLSVAAVSVLMLGFYLKSTQSFTTQDDLGTIQDPQLAYNEVVKSLELISKSLNKGTSTVNYLNSYNKGVSTLNYIDELEQSSNIIFKNKK